VSATLPTPLSSNPAADALVRGASVTNSEANEALSLGAARRRFESSMVARSPDTVRSYSQALDHFEEFLAGLGVTETSPTTAIPPEAAERFAAWAVRRYGRRPRGTQVTYLAGVRAFYRFLDRHALLPVGVTVERTRLAVREVIGRPGPYRAPRIDPRLPDVVLVADATPLPFADGAASQRAHLELLRDRAILRVLYATGMRRSEVASLTRADVADGFAQEAIITGKGQRERTVFFDEATLAVIRAYLNARADRFEPLFLRHDTARGTPGPGGRAYAMGEKTVWNVVRKYSALAGVEASPHDFRHDKATTLLNQGAQLSEVQDILGHASPETTKTIYAHYDRSRLREAFDRFSVAPEDRRRPPLTRDQQEG
jgi:site-specific recombinase XerD